MDFDALRTFFFPPDGHPHSKGWNQSRPAPFPPPFALLEIKFLGRQDTSLRILLFFSPLSPLPPRGLGKGRKAVLVSPLFPLRGGGIKLRAPPPFFFFSGVGMKKDCAFSLFSVFLGKSNGTHSLLQRTALLLSFFLMAAGQAIIRKPGQPPFLPFFFFSLREFQERGDERICYDPVTWLSPLFPSLSFFPP